MDSTLLIWPDNSSGHTNRNSSVFDIINNRRPCPNYDTGPDLYELLYTAAHSNPRTGTDLHTASQSHAWTDVACFAEITIVPNTSACVDDSPEPNFSIHINYRTSDDHHSFVYEGIFADNSRRVNQHWQNGPGVLERVKLAQADKIIANSYGHT